MMHKHLRRIISLFTALFLLVSLAGCGNLDNVLEDALEALEDGDYDEVLELVEEYDELAENEDLIKAVKKQLKNLKSEYKKGELDAYELEEILEDMEDLLNELDNDDLSEQAEELLEQVQDPLNEPPSSGGLVPGFGESSAPMETTPAGGHESPVVETSGVIRQVALITDPYAGLDDPYSLACLEGIIDWCDENYVAYTIIQPYEYTNASIVSSIEQAIAEGCNAIVLPGYYFGGPIYHLQELYPDVYFIGMDVYAADLTVDYYDYADPAPNTACIAFAEEEAGFLAGYAAVMEGYTNLGFLGAMEVPAIARYGYGFIQGADAAAMELGVEVDINYTYCNQYYGSEEITEQMYMWIESGTGIVFACGGGLYTSPMEVGQNYGYQWVIGCDVDMTYLSSAFITSAMKNYEQATEDVLDALHYGNWYLYGGKETVLCLADGDYLCLPTDNWNFYNFSIKDYEQLQKRIASGSYYVSSDTSYVPDLYNTTVYFIEN